MDLKIFEVYLFDLEGVLMNEQRENFRCFFVGILKIEEQISQCYNGFVVRKPYVYK